MKTNELSGAALDWAVAKCEGWIDDCNGWLYQATLKEAEDGNYKPSSKWEQGGEIIEREKIELSYDDAVGWTAAYMDVRGLVECVGSTPLIAAMRCYVASKLGDEVNFTEELK